MVRNENAKGNVDKGTRHVYHNAPAKYATECMRQYANLRFCNKCYEKAKNLHFEQRHSQANLQEMD